MGYVERLVGIAAALLWVSWGLGIEARNAGCNQAGVWGSYYYGAILHAGIR